ncbi:MAG: hypothetical protein WC511_02465 [Candidatus Pacearchaeota archaeon]
MEKIIGSAIKQDGIIFYCLRPGRHPNVIYMMVKDFLLPPPIKGKQGFVTESGKFLSRRQAFVLAKKNGQLSKNLIGSILTSEDLW